MKTVLKILVGLVAAVILALAIAPFVIDINKYKGTIEAAAEQQLRAKVSIGQIRLSGFPFIGVSVKEISIKHRPAPDSPFDGAEALSLGEVAFKIKVKSLIAGKIIAGLLVKEPKISVIKTKDGVMSIDDLLPPKKAAVEAAQPVSLADLSQNKWLKRVMVEQIKIADGQVQFVDQSKPAETGVLALSPLNLTVSSIQLENPDQPMRLIFDTVFKKVDIGIKTGIWLNLAKETVRLGEGSVNVGKGTINFDVTTSKFMGQAPEFDARLQSPGFDLSSALTLAPPLPGIKISGGPSFDIGVKGPVAGLNVAINQITMGIFDGTVGMNGNVGLAPGAPYNITMNAKDIEVSKATDMASGKASLDVAANGAGLDVTAIQKTLQAKGELKLADGKLNTVNLMSSVFSEPIAALLKKPASAQDEKGTTFKTISVPFTVVNGRLIVSNLVLEQSGYTGQLDGSVGLDQTLDLTGKMIFSKEESAAIVTDEKVRGYVTDSDQRLVIPFKVTGTCKSPTVTPDGEYVKTMFANAAKKAVVDEGSKLVKEKAAPALKQAESELKKSNPEVQKQLDKLPKGLF